MQITKHILRRLGHPVTRPLRNMGYRDFTSNDDWKNNLISFTSLLYHPQRKKVICGMTAFNNDLMFEYSPADDRFTDLHFAKEAEKFEIKIHRSLHLDRHGNIYGATACLHREDQRAEAKGGRIFHYDFATGKYDFLGIPVPHDYIQTITVDEDRGLIYGVTYPVFVFFVFDINSRQLRFSQYMGSAPHIMALDDRGGVWSTWNARTHNLFRYDPDQQKLSEYHTGYRGFSRELLESLDLSGNSDDFIFDNEMLAQIAWTGAVIAEVSCPTKYFEEASSISFRRSVKYGFGCLAVAERYCLARLGIMKWHLLSPGNRGVFAPEILKKTL